MTNKYIPLYRKYRPQTFYDLIGQENIVTALSNAIELNRIAHAYLLCGPRGTGKTSSARILAKSLNCKEGPTLKPCGKCPSCLDVMNSVPVDVIEIDAASNRSVEDTQAILEKIQYVPVNGRYKIYVIDEVHMLTNHAFNALLKTLEEPPQNVIFILATTEPHKVLETIISRCQRFDFRRITSNDIVKRLDYISKEENINISQEALCMIAKNSAGGMRDAVALLDQISVLGQNRQIDTNDINELLGKISYDMLFEIAQCVLTSNTKESIPLIDKIYNKGNEPIQIVNNLIQYFRDLLILKNCSDKDLVLNLTQFNETYLEKATPQAKEFDVEQIIALIDKLSYYATQIKETTNKYLWLELCIIDISNRNSIPKLVDLATRVAELESQISTGEIRQAKSDQQIPPVRKPTIKQNDAVTKPIHFVEKEQTTPATQNTTKTHPTQPIQAEEKTTVIEEKTIEPTVTNTGNSDTHHLWTSILHNIESMPSRAFYVSLARPVEISEQKIIISFAKEIFVKQAKEDSKKLPLKNAALSYFQIKDIDIQVILNDSNAPALVKTPTKPVVQKPKQDTTKQKTVQVNEENEYLESMIKKSPEQAKNVDESDQAKMVVQLFDGKYLD